MRGVRLHRIARDYKSYKLPLGCYLRCVKLIHSKFIRRVSPFQVDRHPFPCIRTLQCLQLGPQVGVLSPLGLEKDELLRFSRAYAGLRLSSPLVVIH
jgi:hypothetical protein